MENKEISFQYKNLDGEIVTASARHRIPFGERTAMVLNVVNAVVRKNGNYSPFLKDIVFHDYVLRLYTNVSETDELLYGNGLVEIDALDRARCGETDLFEEVFNIIDPEQLQEMQADISAMIAYELSRTGADRLLGSLVDVSTQLATKLSAVLQSEGLSKLLETGERALQEDPAMLERLLKKLAGKPTRSK